MISERGEGKSFRVNFVPTLSELGERKGTKLAKSNIGIRKSLKSYQIIFKNFVWYLILIKNSDQSFFHKEKQINSTELFVNHVTNK